MTTESTQVTFLRLHLNCFDRASGPTFFQADRKQLCSLLKDGWNIAAQSILLPGAGAAGDSAEIIYTMLKQPMRNQGERYMLVGDNGVIIDNNGDGFSYSAAQDRLNFELDKEKGAHADRQIVRHPHSGYVFDPRRTSAGVCWAIQLLIEDGLP